jgi:predicted DNA-binding transcriptional regulator AlpA
MPRSSRPSSVQSSESTERPNRLRLVRTTRLAELLDVHPATIWRWKKSGVLPPTVRIGGIEAWREEDLYDVLTSRRGAR